jgi:hypothetical protein
MLPEGNLLSSSPDKEIQMKTQQPKQIIIGGSAIRTNDAGLVSLTDIYATAERDGQADGKRKPGDWARESGADFIDFVAENLDTRKTGIYKSSKARADRGGGTYAHWQIALAYAKYLSPELHMQVNEVYARVKSGDVTLADEIADKATPEQQEWLARRVAGKAARGQLTATLSAHGVVGKGYADCTNAIYKPILGGKKSEICAKRGLSRSKNLRDVMDLEQLTRTALAEIVARKNIERYNVRGNDHCSQECGRAAQKVAAIN